MNIVKESISFERGISSKESLRLGIKEKIDRFIAARNAITSQFSYNKDYFIEPGNYESLVRALISETNPANLNFIDFLFDELEPAALDMIFYVSLYSFSEFGNYWQDEVLTNKWIDLGRKSLNDSRLNTDIAIKNLKEFIKNLSPKFTQNYGSQNNNVKAWAQEIINHPKIKPLTKNEKIYKIFKL